MYALDKQMFVEPVAGAIIDQHQHPTSTVAIDGEDKLTVTDAQLAYTKATVDSNVKDFKTKSTLLSLVHGLLPLLMVVIGVVVICGGRAAVPEASAARPHVDRRFGVASRAA